MNIKFAFAIPTYNRYKHLKRAVDSIINQKRDSDVEVTVVLSNSCSDDKTFNYIEELLSQKSDINFVAFNEERKTSNIVEGEENWYNLSEKIPVSIDWVWLLGDDDYLYNTDSLSTVCDLIRTHKQKNLKLIHACQARRSQSSGRVFFAPLYKLCNDFGFLEILGWMSSIICDREIAVTALAAGHKQKLHKKSAHNMSAFWHSAAILKKAFDDNAIFLDLPLAEPQDSEQTPESIKRWQSENIGERYFYVADDLKEIIEKTDIPKFSRKFFRYHTYNIWDRFISFQFSVLLNQGQNQNFEHGSEFRQRWNKNWHCIISLIQMLPESYEQKNLALQCQATYDLANLWLDGKCDKQLVTMYIKRIQNLVNQPIYEFKILESD